MEVRLTLVEIDVTSAEVDVISTEVIITSMEVKNSFHGKDQICPIVQCSKPVSGRLELVILVHL